MLANILGLDGSALAALVTGLAGVFGGWWAGRRGDFQALIEANTKFREEMRADNDALRAENLKLSTEVAKLSAANFKLAREIEALNLELIKLNARSRQQ